MEVLPAALGRSRAHEKARRVPHRSAVNLSIETFSVTRSSCTTVGSPSGAYAYFRLYGDGSSTAPHRAKLLVLPDSSVQDTPVQDFARLGDSDILVGFKEKILLSSEELHGAVASEGLGRVHIDPALMRESVYKHFIGRLISLGALDFSWFWRRSAKFFRCWLSQNSRQQFNVWLSPTVFRSTKVA